MQYPVQAAYQMNRKFLMAQLNHELVAAGRFAEANWAARQMEQAYDSINTLTRRYNEQLNGKWRGMMALSTSFTKSSMWYQKPAVTYTPDAGEQPVALTPLRKSGSDGCLAIPLSNYVAKSGKARLVEGIGYDWQSMLLEEATYSFATEGQDGVDVVFSMVPFWPLYAGMSNRVAVSVDGGEEQVFENLFKEYDRTWKDQVMRNGVSCRMHFAVDTSKRLHTVRFRAIDDGQMLQKLIIDFGGLKTSYVGPAL